MREGRVLGVYGSGIKDAGPDGKPVTVSPVDQIKYASEMGYKGVQLFISPEDVLGKSPEQLQQYAAGITAAAEEHDITILSVCNGSPGPWELDPDSDFADVAREMARDHTGLIVVTVDPRDGSAAPASWGYQGKVDTAKATINLGGLLGANAYCAHMGHFINEEDTGSYNEREAANYKLITAALVDLVGIARQNNMYLGCETGPDSPDAMNATFELVDKESGVELVIGAQDDLANKGMWGNVITNRGMAKYLVGTGRLRSIHGKAYMQPEGDVPEGAFQAPETTLDDPRSLVDVDEYLGIVKGYRTIDGIVPPFIVECEMGGSLQERLERLEKSRAFMEGKLEAA